MPASGSPEMCIRDSTTAEHVRNAFGDSVDILDGGPAQVGIESTVVSIENGVLKLLRPGMLSLGELEAAVAQADASIKTPEAHPAPGMHPRHYSPRTRLLLVDHPRNLPDHCGAYLWRKKSGLTARSVRMPEGPDEYAARLYATLHLSLIHI